MRRPVLFTAIVLILLSLSVISCTDGAVNFESEHISNVALTASVDKSYKPQKITYTFNNDTPRIFCTFQIVNASSGTAVTAEWIYIEGASSAENHLIDSWTEFVEGNKNMAMFIDNRFPNGWPAGNYEVVLYVDGEIQGSIPFKVK